MTLQTSGPISASQIQSEFGGSNPVSLSEYYRDGAYVPDTVTTGSAPGPWGAWQYSASRRFVETFIYPEPVPSGFFWDSARLGAARTFTQGGYEYQTKAEARYVHWEGGEPYYAYYAVRRRTTGSTSSTPVNQDVPTAGTISMTDFYGGRSR